jgi:hypothetical protein
MFSLKGEVNLGLEANLLPACIWEVSAFYMFAPPHEMAVDFVTAKQTMVTSSIEIYNLVSFNQIRLFNFRIKFFFIRLFNFRIKVFWLYFYFSYHCTMSLEKISCQEVVGEEEMGSPSCTQVSLLLHHYNLVSIHVIQNSANVGFFQLI